mmetsp:Transcript_53982/g.135682  ORF Transcript_53982/g.135682 Transcript_53982/m.135682 type:complete len:117 (+) Transcript_53982:1720-2070(+)
MRHSLLIHNAEGQQLHVGFDRIVLEPTPNQALHIKYSLRGSHRSLVLCRLANISLSAVGCKCHVGWHDAIALVVGNDLDAAILVYPNTRVSRAQIDSHHSTFDSTFDDRTFDASVG